MVSKLKLIIPLTLALSLSFNSNATTAGLNAELPTTQTSGALESETPVVDYGDDIKYVMYYKKHIAIKHTEELKLKAIQEEELKQKQLEEKKQEELRQKQLEETRQEELRKKKLEEEKQEELRQTQLTKQSEVTVAKKQVREKKSEYSNGRTLRVNASSYISDCNGCSGITASGYDVRNTIYYDGLRIIAVDPNVIPLYSIVEIEGYGERFIAMDTGGAIRGHKIDILVNSTSEAIAFGRRSLQVKVIREGK
jgi:3D (Asp-Asp-Asp) domain-containing protein